MQRSVGNRAVTDLVATIRGRLRGAQLQRVLTVIAPPEVHKSPLPKEKILELVQLGLRQDAIPIMQGFTATTTVPFATWAVAIAEANRQAAQFDYFGDAEEEKIADPEGVAATLASPSASSGAHLTSTLTAPAASIVPFWYDDEFRAQVKAYRQTYGGHLERHIFKGETSGKGRALTVTGFHSECANTLYDGSVQGFGNEKALSNGCYWRRVRALRPPLDPAVKPQQSTFFPKNASHDQVMDAIFIVYTGKVRKLITTDQVPTWLPGNPLAGLPLKFIGLSQPGTMTVFPDVGGESPLASAGDTTASSSSVEKKEREKPRRK
jgi:hypothetical protein